MSDLDERAEKGKKYAELMGMAPADAISHLLDKALNDKESTGSERAAGFAEAFVDIKRYLREQKRRSEFMLSRADEHTGNPDEIKGEIEAYSKALDLIDNHLR